MSNSWYRRRQQKEMSGFVCPICFNRLSECMCDKKQFNTGTMSDYLIEIDEGIQEHIRILNQKGYKTLFCCEGHNEDDELYIRFDKNHGFGDVLPAPKGFKVKGRISHGGGCDIRARYNDRRNKNKHMTEEEYESKKKDMLDNLLDWCKELPVCKG